MRNIFSRTRARSGGVSEEEMSAIQPDADINPKIMFRQEYLLQHLRRHAPDHIGSTDLNRCGTTIRHSEESISLMSELNATWSRSNHV